MQKLISRISDYNTNMDNGKSANKSAKITTKTGDNGTTGLLFGGRVLKSDARVEAFGTIDEAVSSLGFARALISDPKVKSIVETLQRDLFIVAAELATLEPNRDQLIETNNVVNESMVQRVEELIDSLKENLNLPNAFVVPGDSPESSAIDVSRTLIRKAERRVVALYENKHVQNRDLLRYLNRASDLAYVIGRYLDREKPFNKLN